MTINFGAQQLFFVYLLYPFVCTSVKRSIACAWYPKTMMNSAIVVNYPCTPLYWPAQAGARYRDSEDQSQNSTWPGTVGKKKHTPYIGAEHCCEIIGTNATQNEWSNVLLRTRRNGRCWNTSCCVHRSHIRGRGDDVNYFRRT